MIMVLEDISHLDKGIVEEEHDGREIPCRPRTPEKALADVTDISYVRMAQAIFPEYARD